MDGRLLRSRETKKKLLLAAQSVFREKGFKQATIKQMSEQAGIAYGSAYTYFKGKDDILIHLMDDVMDHFYEIADRSFSPENPEVARKQVKAQVLSFLQMAISERPILRVFHEAIGISERAQSKWEEIRRKFENRIARDIRFVQSRELARPAIHPIVAARGWFASNEAMLWDLVYENKAAANIPIEEIADSLTEIYTRGLYLEK